MDNGLVWLYLGICIGGAGVWLFWRASEADERQARTESKLRDAQFRLSRLEHPEGYPPIPVLGGSSGPA